jgi:hypothetical protein
LFQMTQRFRRFIKNQNMKRIIYVAHLSHPLIYRGASVFRIYLDYTHFYRWVA